MAWIVDHSRDEAVGVPMQPLSPRTHPTRVWQQTQCGVADKSRVLGLHEPTPPCRAMYALTTVCALLLAGCGRPATTASNWINQQASRSRVPPAASFAPVPAGEPGKARSTGDCNVDKINGQIAQGMAVDHLGGAILTGWAGDHLTHAVPATVSVVLVGATGDYWALGKSGSPRPDVAAAQKVPAYAASGFRVDANMYRVPIGDYGIFLAFRIDTQWIQCRTNVRISVE